MENVVKRITEYFVENWGSVENFINSEPEYVPTEHIMPFYLLDFYDDDTYDSYGQRMENDRWFVYHFPTLNVHVKFEGYFSSYDGLEIHRVFPVELVTKSVQVESWQEVN